MAKRAQDEPDDEEDPDDVEDRDAPSVGVLVLRARDVPIALIFRRGPTKQVRMVRWDLRRDDFQRGQWLAGRVYGYRSAVTPDGKYVDYQGMRRGNEWRAIAKLPYFTPLAVWNESGAGGWDSTTDAAVPAWLTRTWSTTSYDAWRPTGEDAAPFRDTQPHATIPQLDLQRREARGLQPWRRTDRHRFVYRLFDHRGEVEHDLGTADWADWHPSGDLAIAREGTISRIPITKRAPGEAVVIVDFNGETFEKMRPPPDALVW